MKLEEPAEQHRLPDRRLGQNLVDPLRGQIGVGRAEVEVEDRTLPASIHG
jgi:hypothetical protein